MFKYFCQKCVAVLILILYAIFERKLVKMKAFILGKRSNGLFMKVLKYSAALVNYGASMDKYLAR